MDDGNKLQELEKLAREMAKFLGRSLSESQPFWPHADAWLRDLEELATELQRPSRAAAYREACDMAAEALRNGRMADAAAAYARAREVAEPDAAGDIDNKLRLLEIEIARLRAVEAAVQAGIKQKQQQAEAEAVELRQRQETDHQRKLKAELAEIKSEQAAEVARLAEIKRKQESETARLLAIEHEQEAAAARLEDIKQKQATESARLAEIKNEQAVVNTKQDWHSLYAAGDHAFASNQFSAALTAYIRAKMVGAPDAPQDLDDKIESAGVWCTCWNDTQGYFDFTLDVWSKLPVCKQQEYAQAYREWYAKNKGIAESLYHEVQSGMLWWKKMPLVYKMRLIPPGKFCMGSPEHEAGRWDDEKKHRVIISKPFYMGECEVTQTMWQAVMGSNPAHFQGKSWDPDSMPVDSVSWHECQKLCKRTETQLPTEAQWEYACRAGTTSSFYWGDRFDRLAINTASYWADQDLWDQEAWRKYGFDNKSRRLHASPLPAQEVMNPWGLYHILGNLWEWCQDWYGDYGDDDVGDPVGPDNGSARVNRGGCWYNAARYCRSAYRTSDRPSFSNRCIGLRLVLPS